MDALMGVSALLFQKLGIGVEVDFAVPYQEHTVYLDETDAVTAVIVPATNLNLVA